MGNLTVPKCLSGLLCALFFSSCSFVGPLKEPTLFEKISPEKSGIRFENKLHPDRSLNILNYLYYYDGAGVAVADIDQDGLPDLFFVGNEGRHALYLNEGNFSFRDVTVESGILTEEDLQLKTPVDRWATGAAFGDVNGDGYPDLFVTYASVLGLENPHALYLNQGDGTFVDRAKEWGIDLLTNGTHVAFLDYDLDGKEDLFLLNHSFHSERTYGPADQLRLLRDEKAGDRLFRNTGTRFEDVTEKAGIQTSALGYGLGVAVSDVNLDGWPDIYVGNDFHENDYLYLNNRNGTFTEIAQEVFSHTSNSSMGNDIADLNNDGLPDIISLDMMPFDREIRAQSGGADPPLISQTKESFGFLVHANHNTLQIHRGLDKDGKPVFQEAGMAAGIAMTDWSWAVLAADFTNSGYKDLFVTNGMVRRPNDLDFLVALSRLPSESRSAGKKEVSEEEYSLIAQMPETRTPNIAFENLGNFTFRNAENRWGLDEKAFASGAAWADLDGDGDLDLIVNNINSGASLFRNYTRERAETESRFLKITLRPTDEMTALGTKIWVWAGHSMQYAEYYQVRGFQSSSESVIHFGLNTQMSADSLKILWPDGRTQLLRNIPADSTLHIYQEQAVASGSASEAFMAELRHDRFNKSIEGRSPSKAIKTFESPQPFPEAFRHVENQYSMFQQEPLVPYDLSARGPVLATGDLDGDGFDEIFIGGSHFYPGNLIKKTSAGDLVLIQEEMFKPMARGEDRDALFFDADLDGDIDLYLARGGSEQSTGHPILQDILLLNDGNGNLTPALSELPPVRGNASVVAVSTTDPFLFVGSHAESWSYGTPSRSFLLVHSQTAIEKGWIRSDGQVKPPLWTDVTEIFSSHLSFPGMITDAIWADVTGDGRDELILVGEWMSIQIYQIETDDRNLPKFMPVQDQLGFSSSSGFWQSVEAVDLNGDSLPDLITGNLGLNTLLTPSVDRKIRLHVHDYDQNGLPSGVMTESIGEEEFVLDPLDELVADFPYLSQRISSYESFSGTPFHELFPIDKDSYYEILELNETRSGIWFSQPDGRYQFTPLPLLGQTTSIRDWIVIPQAGTSTKDHHTLYAFTHLPFMRPSVSAPQKGPAMLHFIVDSYSGSAPEIRIQEAGKATSAVRGVISNAELILTQNGYEMIIVRNSDSALSIPVRFIE